MAESGNKMKYVKLGNTGLDVSRICLGMMSYGDPKWREWVLPQEPSLPFIKKALDLGINFFDTANVYSVGESERITGHALRSFAKRDEIVVATKVHGVMGDGPNKKGLSRKHIFQQCDESLQRLGMDYIDLYQIHRWDYDTPIEETMGALNDLVRSGKVRYIGASSMFAWQFSKAQQVAEKNGWAKFVSMQNHYNLIYREEEREMNPLCIDQGVASLPWSPLARGLLCGNLSKAGEKKTTRSGTDPFTPQLYTEDQKESDYAIIERVADLAGKKGISAATLSLAWLLHKEPVAAPIIGATKLHHLDDAANAVHVQLSAEDIKFLEELYRPHAVAGIKIPARPPK